MSAVALPGIRRGNDIDDDDCSDGGLEKKEEEDGDEDNLDASEGGTRLEKKRRVNERSKERERERRERLVHSLAE